jgi:hypothetical protein
MESAEPAVVVIFVASLDEPQNTPIILF